MELVQVERRCRYDIREQELRLQIDIPFLFQSFCVLVVAGSVQVVVCSFEMIPYPEQVAAMRFLLATCRMLIM